MYLLELNATERNYLLALLKNRRASTPKDLSTRLKSADDVFGVVMWTDDDIKAKLEEYDIPATPQSIERVRHSYYGRHIDDHMVDCGWDLLEQGVLELKAVAPGQT